MPTGTMNNRYQVTLTVNGRDCGKWTEMSGPGQTTQYWIEISNGRQTRRCSIGGYQTQLVDEWQGLQAGSRADMTCYGQSAVSLMGYSR